MKNINKTLLGAFAGVMFFGSMYGMQEKVKEKIGGYSKI